MRHVKLLIISLLYLREVGLAITVRKFVYQKDMSEHCRRRVVPSIFLGRHVAEAQSHILHFSRMDLPYSCFISVRGETGSNIILVVQLLSSKSLKRACTESPNQLLVYEMGETFGGYWGHVPEVMMNPSPRPVNSNVYRLKVEESTESAPSTSTTTEEITDNDNNQDTSAVTSEFSVMEDFFTLELPIVNVSRGMLVDSDEIPAKAFDVDETFDMFYDVTPRSNEEYDTSMLPVVQFSIEEQPNGRREGFEPRYQLQYDFGTFTPDIRLSFSQFSTKAARKKKLPKITNANRLLHFTKNKTLRRSYARQTFLRKTLNKSPHLLDSNNKSNLIQSSTESQLRDNSISATNVKNWKQIDDLLLKVKGSSIIDNKRVTENTHLKELLKAISNQNYNYSVYLHPNLDTFTEFVYNHSSTTESNNSFDTTTTSSGHIETAVQSHNFSITSDSHLTTKLTGIENNTNENSNEPIKNTEFTINVNQDLPTVSASELKQYEINVNDTPNSSEFTTFSQETTVENIKYLPGAPSTGSMVGRESWENVVQAAPVMVEILNQTVSVISDGNLTTTSLFRSHIEEPLRREKRDLRPIPIEIARPHNMTTTKNIATTSMRPFDISDMQEFVQLVELQDDELHDRVALRYLRQYVGPSLFNICEYKEPKARHVFLFNSSRIVLAISNFTLERMTMIVTPARTLLTSNSKCSTTSLECQVYGTRVCIDNINACDGVPNCGAYDVYDEDRLMCGAVVGLQHSVYLAAITFIAVLLTMLYTIHYWLKRCVPKVSEAFFIYTDDAENILYLETIMRSPFDIDTESKAIYPGSLFDNSDVKYNVNQIKSLNVFSRACVACYNFFTCKLKRKKHLSSLEDHIPKEFREAKKTFSFTEFELSKITRKEGKDASVQTGDSLEISQASEDCNIKYPQFIKQNIKNSSTGHTVHHDIPRSTMDAVKSYVDELNILKFLKDSKSNSIEFSSHETTRMSIGPSEKCSDEEEKEIKTHTYDIHDDDKGRKRKRKLKHKTKGIATIYEDQPITIIKSESSNRLTKHLRFEEETVTIPNYEDEKNEPSTSSVKEKLHASQDSNNDEMRVKTSRDFKRFWGGKSKKPKKKSQVILH